MGTSRNEIRRWLEKAKSEGATHMIVACDTFDWGDYPINVYRGESPSERIGWVGLQSMQKVMECYDLSLDWESQLNEPRAMHTDGGPTYGLATPTTPADADG